MVDMLMQLLMKAELTRLDGRVEPALRLYEAAMDAARASEFHRDEAMANELAARHLLAAQRRKAAEGYLRAARHLYERWGARRKVEHMDQEFGQLLTTQAAPSTAELPATTAATLDSASLVRPDDAGAIVLIGSHGGGPPANALKADCRAAIFNDAGIGIDGAGIARLPVLARRGIAAATVSAESARIGDGRSIWESGIVSAVNDRAAAAGGSVGMTVQDLVRRLLRAEER